MSIFGEVARILDFDSDNEFDNVHSYSNEDNTQFEEFEFTLKSILAEIHNNEGVTAEYVWQNLLCDIFWCENSYLFQRNSYYKYFVYRQNPEHKNQSIANYQHIDNLIEQVKHYMRQHCPSTIDTTIMPDVFDGIYLKVKRRIVALIVEIIEKNGNDGNNGRTFYSKYQTLETECNNLTLIEEPIDAADAILARSFKVQSALISYFLQLRGLAVHYNIISNVQTFNEFEAVLQRSIEDSGPYSGIWILSPEQYAAVFKPLTTNSISEFECQCCYETYLATNIVTFERCCKQSICETCCKKQFTEISNKCIFCRHMYH